jgi:hypothetical protein
VTFVHAERKGDPESAATADNKGQFQVQLASGRWLVYVPGPDGKPTLHSQVEVRADEVRQVTLVGR